MPVNEFLTFADDPDANVLDQISYLNDPARSTGYVKGMLLSAHTNKVWRQTSFVTSALAQFVVNTLGQDVLDDGDVPVFVSQLTDAIISVATGGSGLGDAPVNGKSYGRKDAAWVQVINPAGGTMTGTLTLHADPANPLEAATKQYVDLSLSGTLVFIGPYDATAHSGTYNGQAGVTAGTGPLPAPSVGNHGAYVIVTVAGPGGVGHEPAGPINVQDWLVSDSVSWGLLKFGQTLQELFFDAVAFGGDALTPATKLTLLVADAGTY